MNENAAPTLIAAVARNQAIGKDNRLPWRLKADLAHFKATTLGHVIVMGRKTWESLGRPLPGRTHRVITRDPSYQAEGAEIFHSLEDALAVPEGQALFVIGGAEIYRQALPLAGRLILTEVHADIDGDAFFPVLEAARFVEVAREEHPADADNQYPYAFVTYARRS